MYYGTVTGTGHRVRSVQYDLCLNNYRYLLADKEVANRMRVLKWKESVLGSESDLPWQNVCSSKKIPFFHKAYFDENLQAFAHNMQYNSDLDLEDRKFSFSSGSKNADRIGNAMFRLKTYLCRDHWSRFNIVGQQYAYYHEEDESSFQLVDTARTTRPMYGRGRGRGGFRGRYRRKDPLSSWLVLRNRKFVTIFYGSISDFWQGPVPTLTSSGSYFWQVPVPTFDKFRFLPLASSGSSSVSGSSSGSVYRP